MDNKVKKKIGNQCYSKRIVCTTEQNKNWKILRKLEKSQKLWYEG